MKRIKCLGRYQKGILLLMAVMVLVFAVVYAVTIAREGFVYRDAILVPNQENGNTVYSGKIRGSKPVLPCMRIRQWSFDTEISFTVLIRQGGFVCHPGCR